MDYSWKSELFLFTGELGNANFFFIHILDQTAEAAAYFHRCRVFIKNLINSFN